MITLKCILFVSVVLFSKVDKGNSARILGVFPMPSVSHQVVFRAYTNELARQGHELVIITPNPALPKDRPADNVTEIDAGVSYVYYKKMLEDGKHYLKRGAIMDLSDVDMSEFTGLFDVIREEFELPEIKKLIADKNEHFDLVVAEAFFNYPLVFGKIFNAPVIQFSSFAGFYENYVTVGAVSHPLYYPNILRTKYRNLSFWETVVEIRREFNIARDMDTVAQKELKMMQTQFGMPSLTLKELKDNVAMLFLNLHPIFDSNRPVPSNVVYLGALHLTPVKKLPEDLKSLLDNSSRGVVYVSFGTNVRPSEMDEDLLQSFLETFKALPYDILWKFDGDDLKNIPKNVKIQKWFPQRDLLTHPNIKVFLTQGGLQSTDEAIDAGVPLVGIPFLGDQWYNINKYVELGIGVHVNSMTFTAEDLVKSINEVIDNKSYKRHIERLRSVIRDQKESPLERAVWWTGHVLRHGGARHLRAPSANMPWTEYYMLHYIIVLASGVLVTLLAVCLVICVICSKFKLRKIKVKVN